MFDFLGKMKVEVGQGTYRLRVWEGCFGAMGSTLRQWIPIF